MRTSFLLFIQIFEASADVVFQHLAEGQSLGLSCTLHRGHGPLVGLQLYHRRAQTQTTLLSVAESGAARVDPVLGARLQLSGGPDSPRINVSIRHLQLADSGLYMWELSYRERNGSDQTLLSEQKLLLLVEGAGGTCRCSDGYIPLLCTISAAAGVLLLTFCWMATEQCAKAKRDPKPQPHSPIYEEMSRKQQNPGSPQTNQEASSSSFSSSSHLEEVHFPIYANPNIRQQQENYYACPRQLALRAPLTSHSQEMTSQNTRK